MLDDGALDGALLRAGVGDKTTMFCWTLAPVTHGNLPLVVNVAVHPAAEMPQADFVGCGCRISYGGERMPLPAQPRGRLVDGGSLQRAGYCSRRGVSPVVRGPCCLAVVHWTLRSRRSLVW